MARRVVAVFRDARALLAARQPGASLAKQRLEVARAARFQRQRGGLKTRPPAFGVMRPSSIVAEMLNHAAASELQGSALEDVGLLSVAEWYGAARDDAKWST